MTTVFGTSGSFWASDSRWTFKQAGIRVDDHATRKVVSAFGELTFFAGDENPILVQQASILELITNDQYLRLVGALADKDEAYEMLVIAESDGTIIALDDAHQYACHRPHIGTNLWHIGSGGEYACEFFHYSDKKPHVSNRGCNILGAMRYASAKDGNTGGDVKYQVWRPGMFTGRISDPCCYLPGDDEEYRSYLTRQIRSLEALLEGDDMEQLGTGAAQASTLASKMSSVGSSASGSLRKVSLSSEISRLESRLARREAQKAAQETR